MNAIIVCLLRVWQDLTCTHQWVRARHADGSYGYRCMDCWKLYPHTWNQIIQQPIPGAPAPQPWPEALPAPNPPLPGLSRAA